LCRVFRLQVRKQTEHKPMAHQSNICVFSL
jgi:hypothetical protein